MATINSCDLLACKQAQAPFGLPNLRRAWSQASDLLKRYLIARSFLCSETDFSRFFLCFTFAVCRILSTFEFESGESCRL